MKGSERSAKGSVAPRQLKDTENLPCAAAQTQTQQLNRGCPHGGGPRDGSAAGGTRHTWWGRGGSGGGKGEGCVAAPVSLMIGASLLTCACGMRRGGGHRRAQEEPAAVRRRRRRRRVGVAGGKRTSRAAWCTLQRGPSTVCMTRAPPAAAPQNRVSCASIGTANGRQARGVWSGEPSCAWSSPGSAGCTPPSVR